MSVGYRININNMNWQIVSNIEYTDSERVLSQIIIKLSLIGLYLFRWWELRY